MATCLIFFIFDTDSTQCVTMIKTKAKEKILVKKFNLSQQLNVLPPKEKKTGVFMVESGSLFGFGSISTC